MPSGVVQPRWFYTRRWSRVMPAHPSQNAAKNGAPAVVGMVRVLEA